jgi:hypothetical protein
MYERASALLPAAGHEAQDKAVPDTRHGARVGHSEILGINPGGIGGARGGIGSGIFHRFMCGGDFSGMVHV